MNATDFGKKKAIQKSTEATASGGAASVVKKGVYTVQDALHSTHLAASLGHAHDVAGIISTAPFGLIGVAAGTGVSAYFNNLAHKAKFNDLLDNYRPQIAAIVDKTPDKVKVGDLKRVAEVNPALNAEVKRSRKARDLGTLTMALSTAAAFGVVFSAIALFPPLTALAGAAAAGGLLSGAGVGFVAATGLLSFASLHVAGSAIGKLTKKIFRIDKHTVEDHVQTMDDNLKDGKVVSQEEVMGVFTAAMPGMQGRIKYTFGKEYDSLENADQMKAVQKFGRELNIEAVTNALNNGELPARELPFFVHGQASGAPSPQAMRDKLRSERMAEKESAAITAEAPRPAVAEAPKDEKQWQNYVTKRNEESLVGAAASRA